jgi:hypothetical protein
LVSATIDHMISITIFLAAILLFINLFGQTNQTAIVYEEHKAIATKCSDLIDNMLLNPGNPSEWGKNTCSPNGFGLQDPEFTQYQISPFSLMRLASHTGDPVRYDKTSPNINYNNITISFGNSLFMPESAIFNYSSALKLLGINNTYGFQLTLTPVVSVSIGHDYEEGYLRLNMNLAGIGFPFAEAIINSCLVKISLPASDAEYPSYTLITNTTKSDERGFASIDFTGLTDENEAFGFIVFAHLSGLVGAGSYVHVSSSDEYVVPLVNDLSRQEVILSHNYDLNSFNPLSSSLKYNVTFIGLTEDFSPREMPITSSNTTGILTSGYGNPFINVTIPTYTPGILVVSYQQWGNPAKGGVVVMPWGLGSLGFPVAFGGNPQLQEWVATDIRQIVVNHVTYQAKLSLWSSKWQQEVR